MPGMHNHATPAAVMLWLLRERSGKAQVLLQHRHNVKVLNDRWDAAACGRLEQGESAMQAVCREAAEELGIRIAPEDLRFAGLGHILIRPGFTYFNIYFEALRWQGEPRIAEPDKCDGLMWFDVDALPEDMIPERRQALLGHLAGTRYHEAGFLDEQTKATNGL